MIAGLTSTLLIYIFIIDEMSYDSFHENSDRIYRMRYKLRSYDIARVPPIVKEHLPEYFSEIDKVARIYLRSASVKVNNDVEDIYEQSRVGFVDPEILKIFSFEQVSGPIKGLLETPFTGIINEEIAKKYFGEEDPIGKSLILEGSQPFKIIAVFQDFPSNSHIHFDMLLPYGNMYDLEPDELRQRIERNFQRNWLVSHSATYVLLNSANDLESVNNKLEDFVIENIPENQQRGQHFELQPLHDIHLNNDINGQAEPAGSAQFIYIFTAVGFFILLVACFNFINLSTTQYLKRVKEIGMRKILGASRNTLVFQFMVESLILCVLSAVVAMIMAIDLLPYLNEITGKQLTTEGIFTFNVIGGFLCLVIITSIISGLYPSLMATSISPLKIFKASSQPKRNNFIRKSLLSVQFALSIMLISATIIVNDQYEFLTNKDLGFNKSHVIVAPIKSNNFNNAFGAIDSLAAIKIDRFKQSASSIPGVLKSAASSSVPGFGLVNRNIIPEGFTREDNLYCASLSVDYNFIDLYEIEILAGRNFLEQAGSDQLQSFIINHSAVDAFNFGSPEMAIGKSVSLEGKSGSVIGVIEDFNYAALNESVRPIVIDISVPAYNMFSIRIVSKGRAETIAATDRLWKSTYPDKSFDFSFLDENLESAYINEERFRKLLSYFSILAIIVSCLGSYGLILFTSNARNKEFGMRKALGASKTGLIRILIKSFSLPVFIGFVFSVPLTIYFASRWLDNFAYRTIIPPTAFVISLGITLTMVLFSIIYNAYEVANRSVVDSIREN